MSVAGRLAAAAALSFVVSACATTPSEPADRDKDRTSSAGVDDGRTTVTGEKPPSALDDPAHPDFPDPLIDLDDLLPGGPPPNGIPSIDYPLFQSVAEVDWLDDDEPVLSLTIDGKTKAYPIRIMMWHEIVNDRLAGVPVAVTYCPLCNSGVAFERTVAGETTTFKVSGKLFADNLVMYDRLTESLWPQLTGRASVGALTGTQLESIPVGAVGWAQFRAEYPDARVLSRSTGHDRDYRTNPYVGYDDPDSEPLFALPNDPDNRLPVKARVVGVGEGKDAVAVSRDLLADRGVQHVEVGRKRVVLWHSPGQVSALDTREIPDGAEIGSVAAFATEVGGRALDFTRVDDGTYRDQQTGSVWNLFGRAESGPLVGEQLTAVEHLDTFWFAWAAFSARHEARVRRLTDLRRRHLSASASSTSEAAWTSGAVKYDG